MRMKGNKVGDCPYFEKVWFKNLLSLPIAPSMTSSEINKILNSLKFINDQYKSN